MDKNLINIIRRKVFVKKDVTSAYDGKFPMPQEYIDKMIALGKKYRNVRWLPLDIPKFDLNIEEFEKAFKEQCHDVVRVKPDVAEPWPKEKHPLGKKSTWHLPIFKGLHLYHHPNVPIGTGTFSEKMYEGDVPEFKRIVDFVFEHFPMHTITSIFIWNSQREVPPHMDHSVYWECPTEFRMMLYDPNTQPTLYVADVEHGDAHYIDMPDDTNSMAWSNGTQLHGSDYFGLDKYILGIFGFQHSEKSDELFTRSIIKYRDKLNYDLQIDL